MVKKGANTEELTQKWEKKNPPKNSEDKSWMESIHFKEFHSETSAGSLKHV